MSYYVWFCAALPCTAGLLTCPADTLLPVLTQFTLRALYALLGQVAVRPTLPPLTLDALPASLAKHANLSQELPKADWDRLRRTTYRAANFRSAWSWGHAGKLSSMV